MGFSWITSSFMYCLMIKENTVYLSKYEVLFREDFTLIMVSLSGPGTQADYVRSL